MHFLTGVVLALAPPTVSAQAELRVWAAARDYRSGPINELSSKPPFTYKPAQITEYGASLHLVRIGKLRLGVGGFWYAGAFVGEGNDAIIGFKHQVDGYGFVVPVEYHLTRLRDGASLGIAVIPGVEVLSLNGDTGNTRMTLSGGPTLDVAIGRRLGLRIAPEVGSFLASPYLAGDLPEGTRDRTTWWMAMRFGLTWTFGATR